jgi:hypothetical protein
LRNVFSSRASTHAESASTPITITNIRTRPNPSLGMEAFSGRHGIDHVREVLAMAGQHGPSPDSHPGRAW